MRYLDRVILESNYKIEISQLEEELDCLNVKFIICDFSINENSMGLNRKTIETWMKTLIHKPVVGKIAKNKDKEDDFTSHNAKKKYKKVGNQIQAYLKFDTDAFGTFYDVAIEEIDEIEYIVAKAKIWKRFETACKIIQDRFDKGEPLSTSWEISTLKSHKENIDDKEVKIIDDGVFIGHALLSKYVPPAYKCSKVLDVAEKQIQVENDFAEAILNDLENLNNEGGDVKVAEEGKIYMSEADIQARIDKSVEESTNKIKTEYEVKVSEIETELSEKKQEISDKDNNIVELGKTIQSQKEELSEKEKEIEELKTAKAELDEIKAEQKKEEDKKLKEDYKTYILSSKQFTEKEMLANEDLIKAVESLDLSTIKSIIADKTVESNKKDQEKPKEETSEKEEVKSKQPKIDISSEGYDYGLEENQLSIWLKSQKRK